MKNLLIFKVSILLLFLSSSAWGKTTASIEASSIISGGNTNLKTHAVKGKSETKFENKFGVENGGQYIYGESENVRSIERWKVFVSPEYFISDDLKVFWKNTLSANRFSGIDREYTSDLGLEYKFINSEKLTLAGLTAYRYKKEKQIDGTKKSESLGEIAADLKYKINDKSDVEAKTQYFYNFSESDDFQIISELNYVSFIGSGFSLKVGYAWQYDGLPAPGKGKHDYVTTIGLIFKY